MSCDVGDKLIPDLETCRQVITATTLTKRHKSEIMLCIDIQLVLNLDTDIRHVLSTVCLMAPVPISIHIKSCYQELNVNKPPQISLMKAFRRKEFYVPIVGVKAIIQPSMTVNIRFGFRCTVQYMEHCTG